MVEACTAKQVWVARSFLLQSNRIGYAKVCGIDELKAEFNISKISLKFSLGTPVYRRS